MTKTDTGSHLEKVRQEMLRAADEVNEIEKRLAAARKVAADARWEYHAQSDAKALAEQREQQTRKDAIEVAHKREIEAKRKELLDVLGPANYY